MKLDAYNSLTTSIREHLVPINVWVKQLIDFEVWDPFFRINVNEEYFTRDDIFVVPYYESIPAYQIILSEVVGIKPEYTMDDIRKVRPSDVKRWENLVSDRYSTFLAGAVSESNLSQYDNNPDVSVVIHQTTGYIVPFNRSTLERVEVVASSVAINHMISLIAKKKSSYDKGVDIDKMLNSTYEHRYEFEMWYKFVYKGADFFNTGDIWFPMTYIHPLDSDTVESCRIYFELMISNNAKVLSVF